MKTRIRRSYTAEQKARIALEAIREQKTLNEISKEYGVNPFVIQKWKKQFIEQSSKIFEHSGEHLASKQEEKLTEELYQQIGRLKVELDWLKKKSAPFNFKS